MKNKVKEMNEKSEICWLQENIIAIAILGENCENVISVRYFG